MDAMDTWFNPKPQPYETRLRLNARWLPVLVGICFLLQLAFPDRVWTALLVILGGGWLISFIWARSLRDNLKILREMRFGWAQVGDQLQERFTLVQWGYFPALWVEIRDLSTLPGAPADALKSIGFNSSFEWSTIRVCTRRGHYRLGPTTLTTGDPLGIYTVEGTNPDAITITVAPPVIPLPNVDIPPGGKAGDEDRSRANAFERTVHASGVRQYAPGDNLKHIHWRTSARHDQLYVRLLDSTPTSDWWIYLDLESEVQMGREENSTLEAGIILAASLADVGIRQGRLVALVAQGEEPVFLPPHGGDNQRLAVLDTLAPVKPGTLPFADLIQRIHPHAAKGASLILITPAIAGSWLRSLLPLLPMGIQPTVLLLDPLSFGGTHSPRRLVEKLANLRIRTYVITREMVNRPEARPGKEGQWEWLTPPGMRPVAIRKPKDFKWRRLTP